MLSAKSKKYISAGLFFHLIAIIFTIGFYRHDEQREILQVVGYKLGFYDSSYLSYQFHSMIRPWLQPMLYVWPSKLYLMFLKPNPFVLATLYRFLSSILGISSLWTLYKTFENQFGGQEKIQNLYFFFAGGLWFIPFLHARTANENLCTSFFIFGLYFLNKRVIYKNALLAGFMFGVSFILRFQMIAMIAPSVLWFLIFRKYSFRKYIVLTLAFLAMVAANIALDSHNYGQLTFTPYNYLYVNIVEKYAMKFGVSPWYDYFVQGFKEGVPPLSLLFIVIFLILWARFPKSLLTWMTLPFFIVHCFIGHKEFRFIFPMLFLLPAIIPYLVMELDLQVKNSWIILFQVFNIPLLLYFSFLPASNLMKYYEHLYYKAEPVTKVYVMNPFEDYTKFYLKNDIQYIVYKPEEAQKLVTSETHVYFFAMKLSERDDLLKYPQCHNDFSLFPKWIYNYELIKKRRTFKSWTLVECSN
jgi:phosphatidylinositol glycan class B